MFEISGVFTVGRIGWALCLLQDSEKLRNVCHIFSTNNLKWKIIDEVVINW